MKRMAKCLFGLWICTLLTGVVQAQSESGGTARVSDEPGPLPPVADQVYPGTPGPGSGYFAVTPVDTWFRPRVFFDSRAGNLYGYEEAYTNIGAFLPYFIEEDALVFADGRGLVTYDGQGGANLGVGWRYYMSDIDRVVGLSTWWDFDAGHIRSYNQVGLSFESLGRYFDLRLNGYIPIGNDQNLISSQLTGNVILTGNSLLVENAKELETALTGFDAEIGGPMPILGRYGLGGYAGFYFYTGSNGADIPGVSGRLTWQLNEDTTLGVQMTDDHTFGTNTQLQLSMTLPDGKSSRWLRPLSVRDRLTQSVIRDFRVTVEHEIKLENDLALNPECGNVPFFIVHVDPNGADGVAEGDGSFENPFNMLSQFDNLPLPVKQGVHIISVRPRTDDTSINLDDGVTLLTCQRLLSTSIPHFFEVSQQPGLAIQLGGLDQSLAALPILENTTGGDVVTFADGAHTIEVSGFDIRGSLTGSGIAGTNNSNININRNVITGGRNGIQLFNLTGLESAGTSSIISGNIIRGNFGDGINVSNAAVEPLDLIIANNPALDVDLDGLLVDTPGDDPNDDTDGDGFPDANVPDTLAPDSLDGDSNFSNDGIIANGDDGVDINADSNSVITVLIMDNQIRDNVDNGVELDATAISTIQGLIIGNEFTGNLNGIRMSAHTSTLDFLNDVGFVPGGITENAFLNNIDDGIEINGVESLLSFGITANLFGDPDILGSGNGGIGVNYTADGGETLMIIGGADPVDGNIFFSNIGGGIAYNIFGDNLTTSNIENNTIAIAIVTPGGNVLRLGFDQFILPANDDGFTPTAVPLGFLIDFFGQQFTDLFVNNNGNVSFNLPNGAFTPQPIVTGGDILIAPFWADVDTRLGNEVTYGTGTVDGHAAFGVNWTDVRHFSTAGTNQGLPTNSFQLVLIDRSDISPGDFDMEFNYTNIEWEAGEASGGDAFGIFQGAVTPLAAPARVGYTNGTTTSFELPGSAVPGAFLNSGPAATSLINNSLNSPIDGRYVFFARSGNVVNQPEAIVGTQDGIDIRVAGTAQLTNTTIHNNTITGNDGYGINIRTENLGRVTNLVIENNQISNNGGGVNFLREDSSSIDVLVLNNEINQNATHGLSASSFGTALGGVTINMQDNLLNQNGIDGMNVLAGGNSTVDLTSLRDTFDSNIDDGIDLLTTDTATLNATILNPTITNNGDNGIETNIGGQGVLNLIVDTVDDGIFVGPTIISGNGGAGIEVGTSENGLAIVNLTNLILTDNNDGLAFVREGASLILATVSNTEITDNRDDGIDYMDLGSDVEDPGVPLFNPNTGLAPPNRLNLTNVLIDSNGVTGAENGGNGIEFASLANGVLVLQANTVEITNSATDGARIYTGETGSFGNPFTGERSVFDNVLISGNGRDGVKLFAMGAFDSVPTQLVEFRSLIGPTIIENNGEDGIQASAVYGTIDVNVVGRDPALFGFTTIIRSNTGTGIEFNVADTAIDGDDASDGNPNGTERTDGDGDGFQNEILDFYRNQDLNGDGVGDGYELTGTSGFNGLGILNVDNVLIGDIDEFDAVDDGNGLHGIQLFVSNVENFTGGGFVGPAQTTAAGPLVDANGVGSAVNQLSADHDVNRDLLVDQVFGTGLVGGSVITQQAGQMDFILDNSIVNGNGQDGLNVISDGNNTVFSTGNVVNTLVTNNVIARNGRHGVNIDLEGVHGATAVLFGPGGTYTVVQTNQFIFDNNLIERNANYGVRYQSNAGVIVRPDIGNAQDSFFWSEQWQDGVQPTPTPGLFDPQTFCDVAFLSAIFNTNFNTFGTALTSFFYSIHTDLNSNMVFTNNTVQFNGTPGQVFDFGPNGGGDGMFFRVSTNSFLSLDLGGAAGSGNGNFFSGNTLSDVRFESFTATWVNGITAPVPNVSTAAAAPGFDRLYLDDTAQLTLRMNNNIGDELSADAFIFGNNQTVGQRTAAYALNGSPFIGGNNILRTTQMFQVDDAFNLDTNNQFNTSIFNELQNSGLWYMSPFAPDPAFPNPIFPENCFEDFGHPYFP